MNREKRLVEFRKDKEVRKQRKDLLERLLGQPKEGEEDSDESKIIEDVYLKEALNVVTDLDELQKAQAAK